MKKKKSIVIIFLLLTGLIGMTGGRNSVLSSKLGTAERCYPVCKHEVKMPAAGKTGSWARGGEMITSTSFFIN